MIRMPGRLADRHAIKVQLRRAALHTVCEEARCPNIAECFHAGTATFLILGEVCTRRCRFCAISKDRSPGPVDPGEPGRVAQTVATLGLRHAVVTSVTRDDLPDGGSAAFAACVTEIRRRCPKTTVEVLVPDFAGLAESFQRVFAARPEVFNHNLETVPRLYATVRPQADYARSLAALSLAARAGGMEVKSGLMVGLGETDAEILQSLQDLRQAGCDSLTIGQYLQPTRASLPVSRQVDEQSFEAYRREARALEFRRILAGPLVRSSYRASQRVGVEGPAVGGN